jgi:hypothetical protein
MDGGPCVSRARINGLDVVALATGSRVQISFVAGFTPIQTIDFPCAVSCLEWDQATSMLAVVADGVSLYQALFNPGKMVWVEHSRIALIPGRTVACVSWPQSGDGRSLLTAGSEICVWKFAGRPVAGSLAEMQMQFSWACSWSKPARPRCIAAAYAQNEDTFVSVQVACPAPPCPAPPCRELTAAMLPASRPTTSPRNPTPQIHPVHHPRSNAQEHEKLVNVWWRSPEPQRHEGGERATVGDVYRRTPLQHPAEVVAAEWRPSPDSFRPTVLTVCRDGIARVWTKLAEYVM